MTARGRLRVALVGVALTALAGCGQDTPPGEQVPALAEALERVDAAVEAGDRATARSAVEELVSRTAQAEVAGEISDEESEAILDAAASFLEALEPATGDE